MVLAGIAWPGSDLPDLNTVDNFDKIVHLVLFGGVTFLMTISMRARGVSKGAAAVTSFIVGTAYAGLAEIIQVFVPGRDCSLYDLYAGMAGAIVALIIGCLIKAGKDKGQGTAQ